MCYVPGAMRLNKDGDDDTKTMSVSSTQSHNSYEIAKPEDGNTSDEEEESVSHHTDNDHDDMDEDFKAWEDEDQITEPLPVDNSQTPTSLAGSSNHNDDWNSSEWPSIEPVTASSWERSADTVTPTTSGNTNGASALNVNNRSSNSSSSSGTSLLKTSKSLHSSKSSVTTTESDSSLKGRLNQTDIERLKQQVEWSSKEPDYFADMQPEIKPSSSASLSVKDSETVTSKDSSTITTTTSSASMSKLSYVPDPEVSSLLFAAISV